MQNEKVVCEFSSVSGGRLIRGRYNPFKRYHDFSTILSYSFLPTEKAATEESMVKAPSTRARVAAIPELSGSDHEALRSGLASVMSNLDSMLTNIKKI